MKLINVEQANSSSQKIYKFEWYSFILLLYHSFDRKLSFSPILSRNLYFDA